MDKAIGDINEKKKFKTPYYIIFTDSHRICNFPDALLPYIDTNTILIS